MLRFFLFASFVGVALAGEWDCSTTSGEYTLSSDCVVSSQIVVSIVCASENQQCSCPGGKVRYGSRSVNSAAGGTWTEFTDVVSTISCSVQRYRRN
jgi:hypothetical protein